MSIQFDVKSTFLIYIMVWGGKFHAVSRSNPKTVFGSPATHFKGPLIYNLNHTQRASDILL